MSQYNRTQAGARVVLVTGAGSGIGRGIAQRFARSGEIVAVADLDVNRAQETAAELSSAADRFAFEVDVSSERSVEALIAEVIARWGRLDVVCANAGIYPAGLIEDITESEWDRVHNVNLKGTFFTLKHSVAPMRAQGAGRVVVTSSITGAITGFPGWAHYGASKAGQLGLIRSAALEYAAHGITINAVMPGNVRTPAWDHLSAEYTRETERVIPVGRLAEPADIAHAAYFLAHPDSGYITGQTIIVDGGQVLPETPITSGAS